MKIVTEKNTIISLSLKEIDKIYGGCQCHCHYMILNHGMMGASGLQPYSVGSKIIGETNSVSECVNVCQTLLGIDKCI